MATQLQEKVRSGSCPGNWDNEALGDWPCTAAGRWCPELWNNNTTVNPWTTDNRLSSCFCHHLFFTMYKSSYTLCWFQGLQMRNRSMINFVLTSSLSASTFTGKGYCCFPPSPPRSYSNRRTSNHSSQSRTVPSAELTTPSMSQTERPEICHKFLFGLIYSAICQHLPRLFHLFQALSLLPPFYGSILGQRRSERVTETT